MKIFNRVMMLILIVLSFSVLTSAQTRRIDNDDFKGSVKAPPTPVPSEDTTISTTPIPAFEIRDLKDNIHTDKTLRGRVVLFDFWASWCQPCVSSIPTLVKLKSKYGERLMIMGISYDYSMGDLNKFINSDLGRTMNYPIFYAPDVPVDFGRISALPTTLIVDKKGYIRDSHVGAKTFADYQTLIDKLLAE